MKPKITSSNTVHQNPWYKIRHDSLLWENGHKGDYYIVHGWQGVAIIAIQDEKILLINQYRHTVSKNSLEIPMGRMEVNERLEETAKREFEEETGYSAERITWIATTNIGLGFANVPLHIFQAHNITPSKQSLDDTELGMTSQWIDLETWQQKIANCEIIDSESLACWAIYKAQSKNNNF